MTKTQKIILLSSLGIAVVALAARRGNRTSAPTAPLSPFDSPDNKPVPYQRPREADIDALTRMLLVETSFAKSEEEMGGILQVAINRARIYGRSLREVVYPPGSPNWNADDAYRSWYLAGPDRYGVAKFNRARDFVRSYLMGSQRNLVGNSVNFLHPGGMPRCGEECGAGRVKSRRTGDCYTCENNRGRRCVEVQGYGTRCLPSFSIEKPGQRVFMVGSARFTERVT